MRDPIRERVEHNLRHLTAAVERKEGTMMEPLGHISEYGLEKLKTRRHYCVSVSHQPEKEYTIGIVLLGAAEERIEAERQAAINRAEVELSKLTDDYAKEVERRAAAEALLKEASKVLEPFADLAELYDPPENDDGEVPWDLRSGELTLGHLRAARSIAAKIGGKDE